MLSIDALIALFACIKALFAEYGNGPSDAVFDDLEDDDVVIVEILPDFDNMMYLKRSANPHFLLLSDPDNDFLTNSRIYNGENEEQAHMYVWALSSLATDSPCYYHKPSNYDEHMLRRLVPYAHQTTKYIHYIFLQDAIALVVMNSKTANLAAIDEAAVTNDGEERDNDFLTEGLPYFEKFEELFQDWPADTYDYNAPDPQDEVFEPPYYDYGQDDLGDQYEDQHAAMALDDAPHLYLEDDEADARAEAMANLRLDRSSRPQHRRGG